MAKTKSAAAPKVKSAAAPRKKAAAPKVKSAAAPRKKAAAAYTAPKVLLESFPKAIQDAHAEQHARNILLKQKTQKQHLQEEFPVNIAASYQAMTAKLDPKHPDHAQRMKHIESVLTSGTFRRA